MNYYTAWYGTDVAWWAKCLITGCDLAVPSPQADPDHTGICETHMEELRASH